MLLLLYWEAQETIPTTYPRIQHGIYFLKLYWEAQETIPATSPRLQYAIGAVLGSTGDDPYYLS